MGGKRIIINIIMKKAIFISIFLLFNIYLYPQIVDIKRQEAYFLGKLEYTVYPKNLSVSINSHEISFSNGMYYLVTEKMKESSSYEKWYKVYHNGTYWVIVIRRDDLSITRDWEGEEMNVFIFKERIKL